MKPRAFCPRYEFRPNVTFVSRKRLSATQYKVTIPSRLKGEKLPAPEFVSYSRLMSLVRAKDLSKRGLGLTYGLVTVDFDLRFANISTQWKSVDSGKSRQFQGGVVCLDLKLGVYLWDSIKPQQGNKIDQQIFALVMEHELLHILDEIDIVRRWLPQEAYRDTQVKRMLGNASPLVEKSFVHWIEKGNLSDWIDSGLYVPEHNRRAAMRDSPTKYKAYSDEINALSAQRTMQPK